MARSRKIRCIASAASVAALAVASLGITAAAANADAKRPAFHFYPGGCNKETKGGFAGSACINATNLQSTINSDAYIDTKLAGCFYLEIDLLDSGGNPLAKGNWQRFCGTGHFSGPSYSGTKANQPYFSELTIVNGSSSYVIDSPYWGYTY